MPSYHLTFCCSSPWPASILSRSLFLSLCLPVLLLFGPPPGQLLFSGISFLFCLMSSVLLLGLWVGGSCAWGWEATSPISAAPGRSVLSSRHHRQPWVMQPVFLKEEEGASDPRRPFDSVGQGLPASAVDQGLSPPCCGDWSLPGGGGRRPLRDFPQLCSVSLPHFPRS